MMLTPARWQWAERALVLTVIALAVAGCRSPSSYRHEADDATYKIIDEQSKAALGHGSDGFRIEPAERTLRRQLLIDQNLPTSTPASAGSGDDRLIEQWPDHGYFQDRPDGYLPGDLAGVPVPKLTLVEALQVAANNSRNYQSQKESVYQSALALDLERDRFRTTWSGMVQSVLGTTVDANFDQTGVVTTGSVGASKRFKNGLDFTSLLAVDLAKLLSGSRDSSTGITLDTSFSIPLLRGSGKFVVTEPLTQAQRDVVYSIYEFERFKKSFAVQIASDYLSVLQAQNRVENAVENYARVVSSTRRARRLSDAGRLPEIQVDQSVQDELRARNSWVTAQQSYEQSLDRFKISLGLPADANIELDPTEFDVLLNSQRYARYLSPEGSGESQPVPPADAPVTLEGPTREDAGPLELKEEDAVLIALTHRLDLRVAVGRIIDAQRGVAIAADNLRADLTLLGSSSIGESRSLSSAGLPSGQLRTDRGVYSLLLGIDLPFERTAERNVYRNSLIGYERTVRSLQEIEDSVKLDVRGVLRDLLEARESIKIQAEAVRVAQRRVDSTDLFLQAGRAEIRDLLEAQNALNSAQDSLTSAVVNYRIGELELQRDLGTLSVDSSGLWQEFDPASVDMGEIKAKIDGMKPSGHALN